MACRFAWTLLECGLPRGLLAHKDCLLPCRDRIKRAKEAFEVGFILIIRSPPLAHRNKRGPASLLSVKNAPADRYHDAQTFGERPKKKKKEVAPITIALDMGANEKRARFSKEAESRACVRRRPRDKRVWHL